MSRLSKPRPRAGDGGAAAATAWRSRSTAASISGSPVWSGRAEAPAGAPGIVAVDGWRV